MKKTKTGKSTKGSKSTRRHRQKVYKMKGCSKKRAQYGGNADNILLTKNMDVMNPNLPFNIYGGNPAVPNISAAYPNPGPSNMSNSTIPANLGLFKLTGGSCGACSNNTMMTGGSMKGGTMSGGDCGCNKIMSGGQTIDPQGVVGVPWGPTPANWPGVLGPRNYLAYNEFKVDPQLAIKDVGANPPFLYGGRRKKNGSTKRRKQKGGTLSNLLGQDFINLGRQFQYNIGSTYNALNGYSRPVNPLPWVDQLPRTQNLNTIRGTAI